MHSIDIFLINLLVTHMHWECYRLKVLEKLKCTSIYAVRHVRFAQTSTLCYVKCHVQITSTIVFIAIAVIVALVVGGRRYRSCCSTNPPIEIHDQCHNCTHD